MNSTIMSMILNTILIMILLTTFFLIGKKNKWEKSKMSNFECGFSPYQNSHLSFSIHFIMIAIIFLFLDLELCMIMPMMMEMLNSENNTKNLTSFTIILTMGLLMEWKEGKMEWNY